MSPEALPEVRKETELQNRWVEAPAGAERHRWADELLSCLLYTRPLEADRFLAESGGNGGLSPFAVWKAKAVIASRKGDYAQAHYALSESLSAAEFDGPPGQAADILLEWAGVEMNRGRYTEAEALLDKASRQLKSYPRPALQYRLHIRQGWLHLHLRQGPQALTAFSQAERLLTVLGPPLSWEDIDHMSLLYSGLGEVHTASGDRETARQYYHRVVDLCRHYGLVTRLDWHYLHAGTSSMALERWEEAAIAFRQSIQASSGDLTGAEPAAWANLGFTLLQLQDDKGAAQALDKAEQGFMGAQHDKRNLATVYNWKARLAMRQGNHQQVMGLFIRATDYARDIRDNGLLAHICKDISAYFGQAHDYRNAWEYLQLYDDLNERAREEEQARRLMEVQVRYETEKVEREAEALKAQAVELRLQAMRAQMNPHFLFNALNGIQNFIHAEDADKASRYLAKFAGLVRQSLNLSNTELITLEDELTFIRDYLFINQKLRFDGRLSFSVTIDEDIEEDRTMIPPMMIQPFVENAIEHGFIKRDKGNVKVHIGTSGEDLICCTIQDDGIGRKAAIALRSKEPHRESHQSLGIGITAERLELLNRSGHPGHKLEIQDLADAEGHPLGTKVALYFPVRRKQV